MPPSNNTSLKNIVRGGVHIARRPGVALSKPIQKRLEQHGWKHRLFDVAMLGLLVLAVVGGSLFLFQRDPGKQIRLTAVVAPHTVVSGGDSTLAISYTNTSNKPLTQVTLSLTYPEYFALQGVDHPAFVAETNTISIGDLAPGANGLVKIRGVMFGDVGGEQVFATTLGYTWKSHTGSRTQSYAFSPEQSALVIRTTLPDQLVTGQRIEGTVTLTNTGSVTFPEASIRAQFPDGFTLATTSLRQRSDTTWMVPTLDPGEELVITYTGTLAQTTEDAQFLFEPSFVFGEQEFLQDTLAETVRTVPSPIHVQINNLPETLTAGVPVEAEVAWSQQSDLAIRDVRIGIEGGTNEPEWVLETPVAAGTKTVTLIPRAGSGTNRTASFTPVLHFTLNSNDTSVSLAEPTIQRSLTTTVSLQGFARYFTAAGDQLGRGPLPPVSQQDTIYWAFLNVQDTFNDMTDVVVTATLPDTVSWINRQSITKGSGVTASGRTIRWNIGSLPATQNTTVAAATFGLQLTPTASQVGTVPALLTNIRLEGRDAWTGAPVHKTLGTITTRIAEDSGHVQE